MIRTTTAKFAALIALLGCLSFTGEAASQVKNTKVQANVNTKQVGDLKNVVPTLAITDITNVGGTGPGGESREFTINWNAGAGNGKIRGFHVELIAEYSKGAPVKKQKDLGAQARTVKLLAPEITSEFQVKSFQVVVKMQVEVNGLVQTITRTKSGSL